MKLARPRRGARGLCLPHLLVLALIVLLAAPAAAAASRASVTGTTIQYTAGADESNDVHAEPVAAGSFRLTDSAALAAGSGCTQDSPSQVTCTAAGVDKVAFDLRDGDDALSAFDNYIGEEAKVEASGGAGDDRLVAGVYTNTAFDGGTGNDKVIVGDGGGSAAGGAGNDQLEAGVEFEGSLDGGSGDDTFALVGNRQTVTGGPGQDKASYFSWSQCCSPSAVRVALDGAANDGPFGRDDIGDDVEVVEGGSGGDALTGNGAANTLLGHGGADDLNGGAGADNHQGGAGNDRIDSRDSASDSVSCGPGQDSVAADLADLVGSDCESVSRPPGTPATGEPTPIDSPSPLVVELARTQTSPPRANVGTTAEPGQGGVLGSSSAGVGISGRAATLRGRYLRVRLACPSGARLTGVVTLSNSRSGRKLGSTRFRCAAGRTIVARVRLTARTRRLLSGSRSARVRVRVVARDGSGDVTRATRIVRLR